MNAHVPPTVAPLVGDWITGGSVPAEHGTGKRSSRRSRRDRTIGAVSGRKRSWLERSCCRPTGIDGSADAELFVH